MVVITTFDLDEYVYAALRAGARGFLLKDAGPAMLAEAVHAAARGDALIAPSVTVRLLETFAGSAQSTPAAGPAEPLTEREHHVLAEVARGLGNTEIAAELHISLSTVKTHIASIMNKIGARNRVEVAIWALGRTWPRRAGPPGRIGTRNAVKEAASSFEARMPQLRQAVRGGRRCGEPGPTRRGSQGIESERSTVQGRVERDDDDLAGEAGEALGDPPGVCCRACGLGLEHDDDGALRERCGAFVALVECLEEQGTGFRGFAEGGGHDHELVGDVDHAQPPGSGLVVARIEEHEPVVLRDGLVQGVELLFGDALTGRQQLGI